jgi:hypothetical protein
MLGNIVVQNEALVTSMIHESNVVAPSANWLFGLGGIIVELLFFQ